MPTLPGEYLCIDHQGNTSHYAKHNCRICQLEAKLDTLTRERDQLRVTADTYKVEGEKAVAQLTAENLALKTKEAYSFNEWEKAQDELLTLRGQVESIPSLVNKMTAVRWDGSTAVFWNYTQEIKRICAPQPKQEKNDEQ